MEPQQENEPRSVPDGKPADLVTRFVAALIDVVIVGLISIIPFGGIVGAAYMLVRDGLDLEFMNRRSLGKKLLGLRPIRLDGQPMDLASSIKRNATFALGPLLSAIPILGLLLGPFTAMLVLMVEVALLVLDDDRRRLGDRLGNTVVVESA